VQLEAFFLGLMFDPMIWSFDHWVVEHPASYSDFEVSVCGFWTSTL